jgi:hypothetical protein
VTTYRVTEHAAHCFFTGKPLHDLESWDAEVKSFSEPRPSDVPAHAERSHGYLDNGVQHVVWTATRKPERETCSHCEGSRK